MYFVGRSYSELFLILSVARHQTLQHYKMVEYVSMHTLLPMHIFDKPVIGKVMGYKQLISITTDSMINI